MHNNEPTATLLQVLRDLSRTIEQMAPQQRLTAIERDLLLAEMQQLYAQLLQWPVAFNPTVVDEPILASGPVERAPDSTKEVKKEAQEAEAGLQEQIAMVTEEVVEQLTEAVEEALEQALESGKEVEIDIQLEVAEKSEAPNPEDEAREDVVQAEEPALHTEAAATPEPAETTAIVASEKEVDLPANRSVAFSLSGVLQKNGDSQLVMAHLKLKPIDDLKAGIGLNEKFLFIRELFNNDHLAYADAIELLNASSSIEAAEQIIANQLLPHYHWDLETEAAVSFLHLIFRRFAPKA